MFLEILQNSQENTCATVSCFNKVYYKIYLKILLNFFAKYLRITFLQNTSRRLLLDWADGSFIFLKNFVESTSFISKHVQIEFLQEPEAVVCRCQKQSFADVLKSFTNSTGKHLCWILFLIKLRSLQSLQLY